MQRHEGTNTFPQTLTRAERATAREDWGEASDAWAAVVAANPVQGQYWSKLAEARYRSTDYRSAIDAYKRALALRDGFPAETAYRIACAHALLGEPEDALSWLARAWELGFRHLDQARSEDDLASLRDTTRFRALVADIDAETMTREEGWRADLRLLSREVRRRAFDPFLYIPEDSFDAAVASLKASIPDLSDLQIVLGMEKLLASLGDGHARVRAPKDRPEMQRAAPLQFFLFEEGVFITAADPRHTELLGARVLRFGERTVEEVLAALDPQLSRDNGNDQWVKETITPRLRELPTLHALGLIPSAGEVVLTVEDMRGDRRTVTVAADAAQPAWKLRQASLYPDGWRFLPETLDAPLPFYLRHADEPYWFTLLSDERTVYCQFNSVRDAAGESLAAFTERLFGWIEDHDVERLVLDMRWNGGGNTFLERALLHRIVGCRKINRRGALFVIIGRGTFSAAQNGVSFLDFHTEAIFVGEPTGSSPTFIGETSEFELPYSKVTVNVSDLLWVGTWPGDYRIWIAPELYAPPTFAAFRANRDPALEAILACDTRLPGW